MLKQLKLNKQLKEFREALAGLEKDSEALLLREEEAAKAIEEAKSDEDMAAVDEEINDITEKKEALKTEKSELLGKIESIETELEEMKANEPKSAKREEKRGIVMSKEFKFFKSRSQADVETLMQRDEIKGFIGNVRNLMKEKRAVTGAELAIPEIFIGMLRENMEGYSKLLKHVNLKKLSGKGRAMVAGTIPEGVWTEACGTLNELNLVFNQMEIDGYKVGGYIAVCNALLEDTDIALANEIMTAIGQAIGLALDKAILYGTGVKMPVGIVTRLAETAKPTYWGQNEKTWTDLSDTNLTLADPAKTEDIDFYKDIITKLSTAKSTYATGGKFWAMNEQTFTQLQVRMMSINAAGAIVTGQSKTFPIVGGVVELLEFIPDGHIIGGYGNLYLLGERKGKQFAQSEHVQFIEDNTVFKGTARYDGRPVFGEGFTAININQDGVQTAPAPSDVTFALDKANG